jgi:hypothetical protein
MHSKTYFYMRPNFYTKENKFSTGSSTEAHARLMAGSVPKILLLGINDIKLIIFNFL